MMSQLLGASGAIGLFVSSLLIFGLAPGMVLAVIVKLFPKDDPRRRELQAELYVVPRWERPFWVFEKLDLAIRTGAAPELGWQWGRHVWHRARIESGMKSHIRSPETFWVPDQVSKDELQPGDHVKLMWRVKRRPGERMWVTITHREGDKLKGTLNSCAIMANLYHGESIAFRIDDIIDCIPNDEDDEYGAERAA